MKVKKHIRPLELIDTLVAEGKLGFTFETIQKRLQISPSATANYLRRMVVAGLLDRVKRGSYAVRNFGVLGTQAASEDIALATAAAFDGQLHRIGYRSALDELGLLTHPSRTIQVASTTPTRTKKLSGRPLRVVLEPKDSIGIGSTNYRSSYVSDIDRALLDAAARPGLVGGAFVLAEAMASAGKRANPERLMEYAKVLGWNAGLRRIGSIADALNIEGLAGKLKPVRLIQADLQLEPSHSRRLKWRDSRWRVRWAHSPDELSQVVKQ